MSVTYFLTSSPISDQVRLFFKSVPPRAKCKSPRKSRRAFDDTRFNPIATRELPSLECGVTLLTNFQPAADAMAWELGKHGLRISFTYHGRRYGATYLPDVAKEQGWTKEETIVSLMRKAGWSGRRDDWRKVDLNVITYEGSKATLAYAEWKEWRDWVEERAGVAAKALN